MRVDLGIWDKLNRLVIFLLFVAGLLALGFWYLPLIQRNERMRRDIERLDKLIKIEDENGKKTRASITALLHDPKTQERLARQTWGYAKPGEAVIKFEERAINNPH